MHNTVTERDIEHELREMIQAEERPYMIGEDMPSERDKAVAVAQAASESKMVIYHNGHRWWHTEGAEPWTSEPMTYDQARREMTRWRRARVAELLGEVTP